MSSASSPRRAVHHGFRSRYPICLTRGLFIAETWASRVALGLAARGSVQLVVVGSTGQNEVPRRPTAVSLCTSTCDAMTHLPADPPAPNHSTVLTMARVGAFVRTGKKIPFCIRRRTEDGLVFVACLGRALRLCAALRRRSRPAGFSDPIDARCRCTFRRRGRWRTPVTRLP